MNANSTDGQNTGRKQIYRLIERLWSTVFLFVLLLVFAAQGVNIFSLYSLQNVVLAATLILLVGLGETFVIISGGIDISPAYVVGLVAAFAAIIMREMNASGANEVITVIVGAGAGLLFSLIPGLINGVIIALLKVPSFIVTIGTMAIAQGAVLLMNNGQPVIGLPSLAGKIGNSSLLYFTPGKGIVLFGSPAIQAGKSIGILPIPILILAAVIAVAAFVLSRTLLGQHIYAIGGNENASRRAGIPVELAQIKVYMLASLMYGFAAIIYVLRFSIASPNAGQPLLMSAVGAVFIGGASMGGGYGNVGGTVIGALIIAVLQTGLVMSAVSPFWQYIAVGIAIIVAVLFDKIKARLVRE